MIRYLLDTNILSYFIRGNHPALMRRMVTAMQAQAIATSAICRAEICYGQTLMAGNDKRHKAINDRSARAGQQTHAGDAQHATL